MSTNKFWISNSSNVCFFRPAIQRVEGGGCVVLHSIDLKEMKLGPVQAPNHTYKRPMSVGYSIFVPNYYKLGEPVFANTSNTM